MSRPMFTGIITDLGRVRKVDSAAVENGLRLEIASSYDLSGIPIGASIAHNGVCLTIIAITDGGYCVDVGPETLAVTTVGSWVEGTPINLERALKVGDELGGHIVSGHVDGIATIVDVRPDGDAVRYTFEVPAELERYVASKGSVALDGVSLTVNEVEDRRFGVCIIPHTQTVTNFGTFKVGDKVNMEIDMLARYVARLVGKE
jgi:riboflavin synthase